MGLARAPGQLSSFKRPRDYDSARSRDNGASLSMVKNHAQLVDAFRTSYAQDHDVPIILDRWALSQFVYGTIRTTVGWKVETLGDYWRSEIECLKSLYVQYDYRRTAGMPYTSKYPELVPLELHPIIYLPDHYTFQKRRARCDKHYPFHPNDEWNFYDFICGGKLIWGYDSINFIGPQVKKVESLVEMIVLMAEITSE